MLSSVTKNSTKLPPCEIMHCSVLYLFLSQTHLRLYLKLGAVISPEVIYDLSARVDGAALHHGCEAIVGVVAR